MSEAVLVALTGCVMAAINTLGSVLILWIRAHYGWTNGHTKKLDGGPPEPP